MTNPFANQALGLAVDLGADAPADKQIDEDIRDVIIVGSGPAGYTAAIYTARAALTPLVLTGSVDAGGALMNTTEVENFPGFPEGILGPELMENMKAQAKRFGAELVADDAIRLDLEGQIKEVEDSSGTIYRAKTVILAMGSGYRKLGIPAEETYSARGVSWCATCDGFFYRDKVVAVVGGGDSAAEEATFLTRFAQKVYLIHRRDELRASQIMADRVLSNPKIEVLWNSSVVDMTGDQKLEAVILEDTVSSKRRSLTVDGLFEAIGHVPRSELIKDSVNCDAAGNVIVDGNSTRTNLSGVFAAGDLVDGHYRQAITAAGTGCRAALDAEQYLLSLEDAAR